MHPSGVVGRAARDSHGAKKVGVTAGVGLMTPTDLESAEIPVSGCLLRLAVIGIYGLHVDIKGDSSQIWPRSQLDVLQS